MARKSAADAGAYSPTASGSVANGAAPSPVSAAPKGFAFPIANGRDASSNRRG